MKNVVKATPAPDPNLSPWPFSPKSFASNLIAILVALELAIILTSDSDYLWRRMGLVGIIYFVVALALFDNFLEAYRKEQAWRELADQTGLTCRVTGSLLWGYSVQVEGVYRGRKLLLYTYKRGKGQIPSTQIEMTVANPNEASLRLRGPFSPENAPADKGVEELFKRVDAHQFGDEYRFFIRSWPAHLVTNMFQEESVRANLQKFAGLVNIELTDHILFFEQLGILGDGDYLHFILELLGDLADIIER